MNVLQKALRCVTRLTAKVPRQREPIDLNTVGNHIGRFAREPWKFKHFATPPEHAIQEGYQSSLKATGDCSLAKGVYILPKCNCQYKPFGPWNRYRSCQRNADRN